MTAARGTEAEILRHALSLFCAEGYEAASMRSLARRLNMTPAALYYHFDSKLDILFNVVKPLLDDLDRLLRDPPGTQTDVLAAALDVMLEHRTVVMLVTRDRAVSLQPGIGDCVEEQRGGLLRLLSPTDDEDKLVRATAAVGALLRPIVELPDVDMSRHRPAVLSAACGALGIRPASPTGAGATELGVS